MNETPPPVSSDPLREALEALIDIWDDGKHHPDNRAYVSGSFAAMIEEARATLTTIPSVTEPAPPCGHHVSLAVNSAETGQFLYCDLCDAKSGRRDAEAMEFELSEKLRARSSRATEPDRNAARYLWLRDEGSLTWAPFRSQWQMSADKCDKAVDDEMDRAAIATRTATKD